MKLKTEALILSRANGPVKRSLPKGRPSAIAIEMQWNTLLGQQDLLREEIKSGQESLQQVQTILVQSQALLEDWPTYERRCGENCLPCLTELVASNKRIERFLNGWLKRRSQQLAEVDQAIKRFPRRNSSAQPP
jgi:hypothetical protein